MPVDTKRKKELVALEAMLHFAQINAEQIGAKSLAKSIERARAAACRDLGLRSPLEQPPRN